MAKNTLTDHIDLDQAYSELPPPEDFIWPGFLAETVGSLVAPGATGKSFFALQAAVSVAAADQKGSDLAGLAPNKAGHVLYLAAEDPRDIIRRRMYTIGGLLSPEARAATVKRLHITPILGRRLNVLDDKILAEIIEIARGYRLIVVDTLSRVHGLDENDNGAMARLVAWLEYLAVETGAGVLFLHHTSKAAAFGGFLDTQQASRGASALVDNTRWCGYVAKMTEAEARELVDPRRFSGPVGDRREQYVRFGVSKQNYGVLNTGKWFRREEGGVLVPATILEIMRDEKAKGGGREQA
ncbi:MAG: helicase RepA family protein [Desulfobulbia bacterium]